MEDDLNKVKERAKKMMIEGLDWDHIRKETKLRLKDLKRIQEEITSKFQ